MSEEKREPSQIEVITSTAVIIVPLIIVLLLIGSYIFVCKYNIRYFSFDPPYFYSHPPRYIEALPACESNLKNIATALEMYATDNNGDYPTNLSFLTSNVITNYDQTYMKNIPLCPRCSAPYGYQCADQFDNFNLWCGSPKTHIDTGKVHIKGCWPQYTPSKGVKYKP